MSFDVKLDLSEMATGKTAEQQMGRADGMMQCLGEKTIAVTFKGSTERNRVTGYRPAITNGVGSIQNAIVGIAEHNRVPCRVRSSMSGSAAVQ